MENDEDVGKALGVISTAFDLPAAKGYETREELAAFINWLLINDFSKLISILYRLDVDENTVKKELKRSKQEDAADILATLIIDRQLEKIKSRRTLSRENNDINEEEKW